MVVQRILVKEVKLLQILGDPSPPAETIHKVVESQRLYIGKDAIIATSSSIKALSQTISWPLGFLSFHLGSPCTTFGHHLETTLRQFCDYRWITLRQLWDNFEITWKRLYFTFGPHGDYFVTNSGASFCLVASIWPLLILQLAFEYALCFNPLFSFLHPQVGQVDWPKNMNRLLDQRGRQLFFVFPSFLSSSRRCTFFPSKSVRSF